MKIIILVENCFQKILSENSPPPQKKISKSASPLPLLANIENFSGPLPKGGGHCASVHGVLLLLKLQAETPNFTKSNTPRIFFTFF